MTRIVTTRYRYKRPERKKARSAQIIGPATVTATGRARAFLAPMMRPPAG